MELSIIELFLNASLVVKSVIIILIAASIFSWMLIFERWVYLNKSKDEILIFEENFWSDIGVETLLEKSQQEGHEAIGAECIFQAGYLDFKRLTSQNLDAEIVMESVQRNMRVALSREQVLLEKNLPYLATIASVSPYVGLFGTVWGIMNSFRGLAGASQATLSAVAPGISEALKDSNRFICSYTCFSSIQ
jgi:Biopolymer transport proteins